MADIIKGHYADWDADPRNPESWHFHPKKANTRLGYADVLQQLFDNGMEGNLYVQLYRVPDEFPYDADNDVILLEPEDALKILAHWCGYHLFDDEGKDVV